MEVNAFVKFMLILSVIIHNDVHLKPVVTYQFPGEIVDLQFCPTDPTHTRFVEV